MRDAKGKRVLLLQGPNGPFFRRLYDELLQAGAEVTKVNLNAAEELYFFGRPKTHYRGVAEQWPSFLRDIILRKQINVCFLFGDCRPYHAAAIPILKQLGVSVFVFEDGYLRPHYLTVERGGVNARSALRVWQPDLTSDLPVPPPPVPVPHALGWSILHTIVNSLGVTLGKPFFPHYVHHRDVNTARQALLWARSGLRFAYYKQTERRHMSTIERAWDGKYFLVALQVFNDFQIQRSRFDDVRDFIQEVIESFARSGPADARLIFKHHPADRAYRNYAPLLKQLSEKYNLKGRVLYVHDLHLPTLFKHARGTVMINSTVGWSSLHHRTPVFACEETVYGYFGLTARGTLDEFWNHQEEVNKTRVERVMTWLRLHSQANGSVWNRVRGSGPSGVIWPPEFRLDESAFPDNFEGAPLREGAPLLEGAPLREGASLLEDTPLAAD